MRSGLELAKLEDAAAIAALRLAAARELTAHFGPGTWSFAAESESGVRAEIQTSRAYLAREGASIIATLQLSTKNPWLGEIHGFTPRVRPWYLTSMAVKPERQRQGIGRKCLNDVKRIAVELKADAIRLDSYDAPAGAGGFYRACGFREIARQPYHGTPLIFFELLV